MENILIISGEMSGDIHGSRIVREILKLNKDVHFFGIGGDNLKAQGMELIYHIKDLAFLGIIEVIKHLPFIKEVRNKLKEKVKEKNATKIILIDYPGFNLSFAKTVCDLNIPIYYYIAPQLWAWGKKRIKILRKCIKEVLVILPFEVEFFKKNGLRVNYFGHPVMDAIEEYNFISKEEFFKQNNLEKDKKLLVIFPGSRKEEIKKILPISIKAAEDLEEEYEIQVAIAAVKNIELDYYKSLVNNFRFKIIFDKNYELLKYGDYGIIKSGTSTLEAALFDLPFTVIYKTNYVNYFIGKKLVNIDFISLANIISEKLIVNEFIQEKATSENIFNELKSLIRNDVKVQRMRADFEELRKKIGGSGASQKIARFILENK